MLRLRGRENSEQLQYKIKIALQVGEKRLNKEHSPERMEFKIKVIK